MRESRRYQLYGLVALLLLPGLDASMGWQQLTTDTDYSSKAAGLRSLASITDALSGSDGTSSSGHAVLPILSGWPSGQLSVNVTWGSASSSPNQPSKVLKFEVGQPSPTPATASGSSSPDGNISSSGSDDSSNSSGAALQASPAAKTTAANESLHAAATSSIPVDGEQLPYTYDRVNGHEGNPLGLAIADTPGLALSSWVMCAWAVSNFSSPEMLNDTIMSNVESLINNFTVMAPGQIQLAAISNVTVAYAFSGITGPWTAAASGALLQAMSAMAGGYDPSLMAVQLTAPDYGVPALQFVASARVPVQDVPVNNMTIGTRRVGGRGNGTSGSSNGTTGGSGSNSSSVSKGRRRLSRRLLQDGREQLLQQQARGGAVRGLTAAVAGAVGPTAPWGPDVNGTAGSSPGWTKVWVTYTRMAPLNVSMLLRALSNTCGGLPIQDEAPTDMTDTSCGNTMRQLLQQSGLSVNLANFSHWMTDQPMVTVAVRLAVGFTPTQQAAHTDVVVANWLSQPSNIAQAIAASGIANPIGPDALVKWLIKPEIWHAVVLPWSGNSGPSGLSAGAIAGIAVGCFSAAVLAGVGVLLLVRHRRKQQAGAYHDYKDDAASSTASGRRRRRRQGGKRRYLAPEPRQPSADGDEGGAAGGAAAVGPADLDSDGSGGDAVLHPDQIRPAMKELGDSVTSAVRYELEDAEEEAAVAAGADVEAAAARTAAVAAATGFGGIPTAEGGDPSAAGGATPQRVLAARAALIAEQQQQQLGVTVGARSSGSSSGGSHAAAAAAAGTPIMDEDIGAEEPCLVSRRGGWVPGAPQQQHNGAAELRPAAAGASGLASSRATSASMPPTPSGEADRVQQPLQLRRGAAESSSGHQQHSSPFKPALQPLQVSAADQAAVWKDPAAAAAVAAPGWSSPGSSGLLGPATPQPLPGCPVDLAALGITTSPLPKLGGKAKASPFAVAYNFADLGGDTTLSASADSSGVHDAVVAAAVAAAPPAAGLGPGPSAAAAASGVQAGDCSPVMVSARSSFCAAAPADVSPAGAESSSGEGLLAVGSTQIVLASDGSFKQVTTEPEQQQPTSPLTDKHGVTGSPAWQQCNSQRCSSGINGRCGGEEQQLSGCGSGASSSGSSYNKSHSVRSSSSSYPSHPSTSGPSTHSSIATVGSLPPCGAGARADLAASRSTPLPAALLPVSGARQQRMWWQ